jgi:5,10-methenyltetrahydromethanopterin hydrogenase
MSIIQITTKVKLNHQVTPPIEVRDSKNLIAKTLKDTVQHNPKLNIFLVPHNTDVFEVTKEDCNSVEKVDCVHIWAVKWHRKVAYQTQSTLFQ